MDDKDKRQYTARSFVTITGRWYVNPDKNGRFSIPKAFAPIDKKKGYNFKLLDDRTILLTPNKDIPVLKQLCIPSQIRSTLKVKNDGSDIYRLGIRENSKGFTLMLCQEEDII